MRTQTTLYKVLNEDGSPCNGGSGKWLLPTTDRPGEWMPVVSKIVPCVSGYHVTTLDSLLLWIGPAVYEVEIRGKVRKGSDKLVASEARLIRKMTWSTKSAYLFSADCAEHVLHIWMARYPNDTRVADCIAAIRAFVRDEITLDDLGQAQIAASAAAHAAAAHAAAHAAYAAAHAAAAYAAAAEHRWQMERLAYYLTG